MRAKRVLSAAVVATFVAACSGTAPTPTSPPTGVVSPDASVVPSPTASPEPTASPTPTPIAAHTIADLLAMPLATTTADEVAAAEKTARPTGDPSAAYRVFGDQCATTWSKASPKERAVDRQLGCLAAIAVVWKAYSASRTKPEADYALAVAMYSYAASTLGDDGKVFLDAALARLESPAPASSPPPASPLESLDSVAKAPYKKVDMLTLHRALRNAVTANVARLESLDRLFVVSWRSELNRLINPISECEYASPVESSAVAEACANAASPIWSAYLATGDVAFYDVMVGLQNRFLATRVPAVSHWPYIHCEMVSGVGQWLGLPVTCRDKTP